MKTFIREFILGLIGIAIIGYAFLFASGMWGYLNATIWFCIAVLCGLIAAIRTVIHDRQ